jgi:uncharacterized protein with HEPN domain
MPERSDRLYLADILDAVGAIEDFVRGMEYSVFAGDRKTRSAVIRELEVIGEAAGRVSNELKALHPDLDWRMLKDFRNILAHEYFGIDNEIVWEIVTGKIAPLKKRLVEILPQIK